jgi:hypothetical protein
VVSEGLVAYKLTVAFITIAVVRFVMYQELLLSAEALIVAVVTGNSVFRVEMLLFGCLVAEKFAAEIAGEELNVVT